MNRKARINYIHALSSQVERKKMYKAKKQWVVAGISFLVATGMGAIGSHLTTHAASTNPTVTSNASNNIKQGSASVEPQAKTMHNALVKNAAAPKPQVSNGSQVPSAKTSAIPVSSKISGSQVSSLNTKSSVTSNIATSGNSMNTLNLGNSSEQNKGWNYVQKGIHYNKPLSKVLSTPASAINKSAYQGIYAYLSNDNTTLTVTGDMSKYNASELSSHSKLGLDENNNQNFANVTTLNLGNITNWQNGDGIFMNMPHLQAIHTIGSVETSKLVNAEHMFAYDPKLTDISGLANWNTTDITNMISMFQGDSVLRDISPLTNWNTSNVNNMASTFQDDNSLSNIQPISSWDVSNVRDMESMIRNTSINDLSPLSNWNTSNVNNMWSMFQNDFALTSILPLANWNTTNVKHMNQMFEYTNIKTTDVAKNGWTFNNKVSMNRMCYYDTTPIVYKYNNSLYGLVPIAHTHISRINNVNKERIQVLENDAKEVSEDSKLATSVSNAIKASQPTAKETNAVNNDIDIINSAQSTINNVSNQSDDNRITKNMIDSADLATYNATSAEANADDESVAASDTFSDTNSFATALSEALTSGSYSNISLTPSESLAVADAANDYTKWSSGSKQASSDATSMSSLTSSLTTGYNISQAISSAEQSANDNFETKTDFKKLFGSSNSASAISNIANTVASSYASSLMATSSGNKGTVSSVASTYVKVLANSLASYETTANASGAINWVNSYGSNASNAGSWYANNSTKLSSMVASASTAYTDASDAISSLSSEDKRISANSSSATSFSNELTTINTTLNKASSAISWVDTNSETVTNNISSLASEKNKIRKLAIQAYSVETSELNHINDIVGNSKADVDTNYSNANQAMTQATNAANDAVTDINTIQNEIKANSGNIYGIQQQLSNYNIVSTDATSAMSSLNADNSALSWLVSNLGSVESEAPQASTNANWISNNSASVSSLSNEWSSVNAQISTDSAALNQAIDKKADASDVNAKYNTLSGDITTASSIAATASTAASNNSSAISSLNSLSVEAFFASSTTDGDVLIDANGNKEVGAVKPAFIGKLADFRNNNQLASVVPKNYRLTANQKLGLKMISINGAHHLVLGDTQSSNLDPVITVYGDKASDLNKHKPVVQPTNASDAKNNVQTNANAGYVTVETIKMSGGQKISDTYNLVTENNNNVGDKYTIKPQTITNYTFDKKDSTQNLSGVMNDDGSLTTNIIVKLVYNANAAQPITIDYQDQSGNLVKSDVLNGTVDETGSISNLNALPTNIQSDYTLNNPIKYTFGTNVQTIVADVTGKSAQQIINQHNNGKQPIKPVTPQPIPSGKKGSNTNPASDDNNPLNPTSKANNHVDSDNAKVGVATINIVEYNNANPRKIVKEYALPVNVFSDIKNTTGKNAQIGDIDTVKASDSSINPQGFSSSDSNKPLSIKINADGSLSPYNATFNYDVNENNIAPVNVTYKTSDGTDITLRGSQLPKGQYSTTLSTNDLASLGGAGSTVDIIPLLKKLAKVPTNYHFNNGETCDVTLQTATPRRPSVLLTLGITSNAAEQAANSSANVVISSNSSAVNNDVSSANSFMSNPAISGSARTSISNDINIINSASSAIQSDMNKGTSAESSANDALASASNANADISSIASSILASSSVANLASLVANDVRSNQPANTETTSLTSDEEQAIANDIDGNIKSTTSVVTNTVVDHSALTSLTNEVATNNSEINSLANKPAPTATVNYNNFDNLINNGIDRLEDTINKDFKANISNVHAQPVKPRKTVGKIGKRTYSYLKWLRVVKPLKLYTKNGVAKIVRPNHRITLNVKAAYKVNNHIVFKISYKHHNYLIKANNKAIKNAYLPATKKLVGRRVRVLYNVYANKHKTSGRVKTLHKGYKSIIKHIVRIGSHNVTRIQLSNGLWISANMNYVEVL